MSLIKSRKRIADHKEVFTPAWMVDAVVFVNSTIRPMGEADE